MKNTFTQELLIISIFGGFLGFDKFYQGSYKLGFLKLVTFGGYGIWWIIDIIIIYNRLEHKIDQDTLNFFKTVGKIIGAIFMMIIFLGFILLIISFYNTINNSPTSNIQSNIQHNEDNTPIIIEEKKEENKIDLEIDTKKEIYYIYWQSEHIALGKTHEKFGNGGEQTERDEYFKNTKIEYEKKLTQEKGIDYELYNTNSIKIYGEGDEQKWIKPTSENDDVLKYVYGEEKYNLLKATKDFLDKKVNLSNLQTQCSMYIQGDGFLSSFNRATIKQISENQINVITTFNGKNAFGKKVTQTVTCQYKYNTEYKKYEIFDIEL